MKRQHDTEKEGEEPPRFPLSIRTRPAGNSGGRHDGPMPIMPLIMRGTIFSDGNPVNTSTPLQLVTSTLSDDDEDEASSGNCTPSPSNLPLLYEPSTIGSANCKRMRTSHKMENERGAVEECKLWDKLPLTLKQEDIAWFVGTSLSEDDCVPLHEGEGAFDDAEGDDEGDA